MKPVMTYQIAQAIAFDAANAHMKAAGRAHWNEDDYNVASDKLNELLDRFGL